MTTLLPCPFCGGLPGIRGASNGFHWVTCEVCGAEGPVCESAAGTSTVWNGREYPVAESPLHHPIREALEAAYRNPGPAAAFLYTDNDAEADIMKGLLQSEPLRRGSPAHYAILGLSLQWAAVNRLRRDAEQHMATLALIADLVPPGRAAEFTQPEPYQRIRAYVETLHREKEDLVLVLADLIGRIQHGHAMNLGPAQALLTKHGEEVRS